MLMGQFAAFVILIIAQIKIRDVSSSDSFVALGVSGNEHRNDNNENDPNYMPDIYEMTIDTNVSNRYAETLISSKVRNLKNAAKEVTFSVIIPKSAFISAFTLEIGGKQYDAFVREKEEASAIYENAKARGWSAGHVAASARDSNRFTVSVNVEPQSKASFYLKYEELLSRVHNRYEIVYNINPGQPVKHLEVHANITELRPLKFVKVPSLRTGNEISKEDNNVDPGAGVRFDGKTTAIVSFKPTLEKQDELSKKLGNEASGLSGQFVIQYDVERDPQGGEVLVDNGHFIHFFAPDNLTPLKKEVIFVLDISSSMAGTKIEQLKKAMKSILGQLKPEDIFSVVQFSSGVQVWDLEEMVARTYSDRQDLPPSVQATADNINRSQLMTDSLRDHGLTNIFGALKTALKIIKPKETNATSHQPIIIFLTDGFANVGPSEPSEVVSKVTDLNKNKAAIYSLSFGDGADKNFLKKLSSKNQAFSRHIYEAGDAALQLEDFYAQISSPLLSNVTFKYTENVVDVTKTQFPLYFYGSEIYITGIIRPGFVPYDVVAWGYRGPVHLPPRVTESQSSLERLWAYLNVKELLKDLEETGKKELKEKAIKLALKYSFVTDVTSLVVVKPNFTITAETVDASKGYPGPSTYRGSGIPASGISGFSTHTRSGITTFGKANVAGAVHRPVLLETAAEPFDAVSGFIGGGRYPLSSPASGSTIWSSTTFSPTTALPKVEDALANIPSVLSWLRNIVSQNGTITINSGVYNLGLNETIADNVPCSNPPHDSLGNCSLIHQCKHVHSALTDFQTYVKYFCEIKGYAGVCCPPNPSP